MHGKYRGCDDEKETKGGAFWVTENRVLSFDAGAEFYQKRAAKAMEQQDYTGALKYLRRAVKMEPDNLELRMDMANAYALMGLYERSNLEIQLMFHKKELPAEALFGMASNYMALGDYDQADVLFQVYQKMEPEGEYFDQACEALGYLAECDYETPLDRELDELSMDGKAALDAGDIDHAIECLEKALEKDPDMTYARNNLAVAYYCIGNMDKAWEHLDQVLAADPLDVHGRCNESLFCLATGDREGAAAALARLRLERIEELDELFKYCLALADTNMDQELMQALKKIFLQTPYDGTMLYLCGACQYNLGRYAESMLTFEKLTLTEPDSLLAAWGLKHAGTAVREGTPPLERLSYSFDLPADISAEISACLEEMTELMPEQVAQRLEDDRVYRLLHAAVTVGTEPQMGQGVLLLGYSGCAQGERILRELLLSPTHSSYFKQMVMQAMRSMGAAEPYHCLQDGKLVTVRSKRFDFGQDIPSAYLRVMHDAIDHMRAIFKEEGAVEYAAGIWAAYMMFLNKKYPKLTNPFAWVKAIEGLYLEKRGAQVDWKSLARDAGVTERTLSTRKKKLVQASDELEIRMKEEEKDGI